MVEDGEGGVTTGGGNIARFDGALLYVAQFCMSSNAQHRGDGGLPSSSNSNGGGAQDVHARDNVIKRLGCDESVEARQGEDAAGHITLFKVSL